MNRYLITVFVFCVLLCPVLTNAQTGDFPNYALYDPPETIEEAPILGSRLLFELSWAHAKVVAADNHIIKNDSLFFNFDKMSQKLLITEDYRKIYEVDKREFKSVTFYWHDSVYIFQHVFEINKNDFFQELVSHDQKYSLYKFIRTAITRVNWRGNSFVPDGRSYEQYSDKPVYYIIFPNKEYRILYIIGKRTIERVFSLNKDIGRVKEWLSAKTSFSNSESELMDLIIYLNN